MRFISYCQVSNFDIQISGVQNIITVYTYF